MSIDIQLIEWIIVGVIPLLITILCSISAYKSTKRCHCGSPYTIIDNTDYIEVKECNNGHIKETWKSNKNSSKQI